MYGTSALTTVITESGYSGSGGGVKVCYTVAGGEWEAGGERLLLTQNEYSGYSFHCGTGNPMVSQGTEFSQYSRANASFSARIELDASASVLYSSDSYAVETSDNGDGHRYFSSSPDGKNSDTNRRDDTDVTTVHYSFEPKTPEEGNDPIYAGGGQRDQNQRLEERLVAVGGVRRRSRRQVRPDADAGRQR